MKKPRKDPFLTIKNGGSAKRFKQPKKSVDVFTNGTNVDIVRHPIPVCSCTGTPQQCYRWGSGGWQSACCTTMLSEYPLTMSTKRRGARIAGRKMSVDAFKKASEKLAFEGYDFSKAIDLRTHWAKHGTNKFFTIRWQQLFCYSLSVINCLITSQASHLVTTTDTMKISNG